MSSPSPREAAEPRIGKSWKGPERSSSTEARLATRANWKRAYEVALLNKATSRILTAQSSGRTVSPSLIAEVAKIRARIAEIDAEYPEVPDA